MLDAVEDGEELRFAALWTLFVGVTINVLASVLLVVLVYYMWRRQLLKLNLFVSMVTMMSISSAVAVGNFYQKFVTGPSPQMLSLSRLFVGIFGVSESLWGFQIISTVRDFSAVYLSIYLSSLFSFCLSDRSVGLSHTLLLRLMYVPWYR